MLIRSGDTVEVRTGNAKGTRAKVLQVLPEKNGRRRIVVEGVNRVYRHIRRSQKNPQGGRLSKEMPIDASNVLVVCTACGRPSRLGAKVAADGGKSRVCKKCGADLGAVRRPRATKRAGA
ncbi:MAG: 50S ribosomal protein L24 [Planctomycetota bacterium]|nr:50S ribosomal protein L24 [Planctomycetota bacterium]